MNVLEPFLVLCAGLVVPAAQVISVDQTEWNIYLVNSAMDLFLGVHEIIGKLINIIDVLLLCPQDRINIEIC